MSGKHIVVTCASCGSNGSVAVVAVKQAHELSKYFEQLTLVSDSLPDDLPGKIGRGLISPRRFNYLRRFCHVPNEYSFVRGVRKHIEELHRSSKVDFIVCHGHSIAALAARPLKRKYGIPYALVTHGDIFERPKGTYDARLTAFYEYVTPPAYKNADLVIALSPYMAEWAIKGGAMAEAVRVIPNGIDPDDIGLDGQEHAPRAGEKKRNAGLRLLFIGRLAKEKGIEVLIKACELLDRKNRDISLEIIGDGPLEQTLRHTVEETGLSDHVSFLGRVDRRSLGVCYQAADLVCVPSLSDSLPAVVLEALVSGTPVVGSDVGGIPFMLKDHVNGILVPPGNVDALAGVIEEILEKPDLLEMLRNNARSSVLPLFSWDAVGMKIRDFMKEKLA